MSGSVRISNAKYFRQYDGTDNQCCGQVDVVGEDVRRILEELGIEREEIYEDWGAAFWWTTGDVGHGMQLECSDGERAEYQIEYGATRRKWLLFSVDVPDANSDFSRVIPKLQQLGTTSTPS